MPAADEEKLTGWMAAHAGVTWSSMPEPWLLEQELLKTGPRLPLNISGSDDAFRHVLKGLRAAMKKASAAIAPRTSEHWIGQASDITMLGKVKRVVDHTSEEQRRNKEEHARILSEVSRSSLASGAE